MEAADFGRLQTGEPATDRLKRATRGKDAVLNQKTVAMDKGLQHPRDDARDHHLARWPCGYRAARAGFDSHELQKSH